MMKKLFSLTLILAIIFAFTACKSDNSKKEETTSTVSTNVEKPLEEEKEEVEAPPEPESVSVGNTITVDFAEVTVDEAAMADNIQTSIKTGNVTRTAGPQSSDDKEFIYIRGNIKNTGKEEINIPLISGKVVVNGYSYNLKSINIIESDGSSTHSLSPLINYQYTLYTEIPNELAENFTGCTFNFGFEEKFKNITYSDTDYVPPYNYTLEIVQENQTES